MLLALPILVPLLTAVVLHLLPQRGRLLRVVAFGGSVCALAAAVSIFVRVQHAGIQVLNTSNFINQPGPLWNVPG